MKIVSKITLKNIGAQPAANAVIDGQPIRCAQIYGTASECETKRSSFDQDYTVFKGNFEAINLGTGEIFRSGVAILPAVFQNLLAPVVIAAKGEAVSFSVEFGAKHSAKGSVGYEWTATPLIETSETDTLADLREQTKAATVALLEGPKHAAKKK